MKRYDLHLDDEFYTKVKHFTKTYGARGEKTTINDFILTSLDYYMRYCVGDYNVSEMSVERLNQLVDVIAALNSNVSNLNTTVTQGFSLMYNLASDDNYLNDESGDV